MKTFNSWLVTNELADSSTRYVKPSDPKLEYGFDTEAKLEVKVKGDWIEVSPSVLRSWSGERRVGGKPYDGEVYLYLTNEPSKSKNLEKLAK